MKLLRIARSEGSKEIIKFIKISKHCPQKDFTSVIQHIFGNPSTIGCAQILTDTSGKKVPFDLLVSNSTYFVTFEKKDIKSLLNWETPHSEFVSLSNSANIQVLDQSDYMISKINNTKSIVKDKATELLLKQEDSILTLTHSLLKIHNTLGSQSLQIIDYTTKTKAILNQVKYLIPLLQQSIQDTRQNNDELRTVYAYQPPEIVKKDRKKLLDPRVMKFMKEFSYRDIPANELTPGELRRFMKFQMIVDNQITQGSSQNTPSAKRKMKKIQIGSPFSKK